MQMSKIRRRNIGKRGLLSTFLAFFGATLVIIAILVIFVFSSVVIKKLNKVSAKVAIYNESEAEIDNVFNYSDRFVELSEVKFLVAKEKSLNDSLTEVGYG